MATLLLIALASATVGAGNSEREIRPKLAVLPLKPMRVPPDTTRILDELLVGTIHRSGRFDIITGDDVNAMLQLAAMKDAIACDSVACAAEIGGALGVKWLMTGSASRLGDEMSVRLTLIDIESSRVASRGQFAVKDDERNYAEAVRGAAAQVMGSRIPSATSSPSSPSTAAGKSFIRVETGNTQEYQANLLWPDGGSQSCSIVAKKPCVLKNTRPGAINYILEADGYASNRGSLKLVPGEALVMKVSHRPSMGSIALWASGGGVGFLGGFLAGFGALAESDGLQTAGYVVLGAAVITAAIGLFLPSQITVGTQEMQGVVN